MKPNLNRTDFVFQNRPVRYDSWNGDNSKITIPCIVMCHRATGIAVAYPGYERWYIPFYSTTARKIETYRKKARAIKTFLNYILSNSTAATLQDITLKDIMGFLIFYRTTEKHTDRAFGEWERDIECIYSFLSAYYKYNHDRFPFAYDPKDLYKPNASLTIYQNRLIQRRPMKCNYFGVKRPQKTLKKLRFLPEQFLDIILMVAKAYDPMLVLPIALQSYAGLRKGEVVNLTRDSIRTMYGGFGTTRKIVLDISKPASFALTYEGVCDFGSIKVPRIQEVYPDFIPRVQEMILTHYKLLDDMGTSDAASAPLFFNYRSKALTVDAYTARVRNLFKKHFLPVLIRLKDFDIGNTVYQEYYEAYSRDYPGAHMFRHWFTMYLIMHIKCTPNQNITDLVSKWRGDKSREGMESYVHANAEVISHFQNAIINYQKTWVEEVLY